MVIQKLGGGTYNLSLSAVITKAAGAESAGGASTAFNASLASGSAVVSINAEEEISVTISDAVGRHVISAQLQPWDGPQPFAIITWNCSVYDDVSNSIAGFGTVLESRRIDALGYKVKSRSDGGGRTLETYDQENFKSTAQYDANSNVTQSRDPNNVGFNAVYDNLNRQTSQTDTFGDTTGSAFDKESNQVKSTDAKSNFTVFSFDALNRRKTVTDRLNGVTTFGYTPTSQLSALTDAENQSTLYDYNDRGEKTKETYPDHVPGSTLGTAGYGIVEFAYDPAGRTKLKTDQMGDTCTFNHDLAGRMFQRDYRTFANSPSGTIADSDIFTFDRASRMLTGHSGRYNNDVGMGYDFGGRLSSESLTIAGQTYSVGRAYDTRGLEASMTYPNGSLVERTYSPRQQLHQTKYLGTGVDARTYDSGGRHATSTYANGAVTTNAYRLDNLLSSRATSHAGTEQIGTYSYTWDANKNKTGEAITGTMAGFGFSVPTNGYDHEDRVTAWNRTDGNKNQSWNLSLVGDWNTHVDAGVTQTRTHGPAHEFTSVTIGGTPHALSYDPKGNMLTRPAALSAPALNLVWDFDNQLKGADIDNTPASLEVTFEFDALGRRVARNEGSSQVVFIQAGQQTIADYTRTSPSSSPTYRYVYASYIDEPILRHSGTSSTLPTTSTDAIYYHRNQQYSITALTDAAGNLVERYAYSIYGVLTFLTPNANQVVSSPYANNVSLTGRVLDNSTRLIFFRSRFIDELSGRFLSRDRLGYIDGLSIYLADFLTNQVDPMGYVRLLPQTALRQLPRTLPPRPGRRSRPVVLPNEDWPFTTGVYTGYWQLEHIRYKRIMSYHRTMRCMEDEYWEKYREFEKFRLEQQASEPLLNPQAGPAPPIIIPEEEFCKHKFPGWPTCPKITYANPKVACQECNQDKRANPERGTDTWDFPNYFAGPGEHWRCCVKGDCDPYHSVICGLCCYEPRIGNAEQPIIPARLDLGCMCAFKRR